jgi:plasmid rolling circle replication initiator protein Rep
MKPLHKGYLVVRAFLNEHPETRVIWFTLTRRNVARSALLSGLEEMDRAFEVLMRVGWRAISLGWLRVAEVNFPAPDGTHPHFHCVVIVRDTYVKKYRGQWVDVRDLSMMWGTCLGVDYLPIADMRMIKGGDAGVRRVFEYLAKPVPEELQRFQVSKFGGGLAEMESRLIEQAQDEVQYARR